MRTILIIDDDIAIGNMEQEVLERAHRSIRYQGHCPRAGQNGR